MSRRAKALPVLLLAAIAAIIGFSHHAVPSALAAERDDAAPGQLTIVGADGKAGPLCPLQSTKVSAEISGFGARVTVVQTFVNPTQAPIEAIYTFPLPNNAAVDRMRMKVGDRVIVGVIKRREEAKQIYETAKQQGKTASLLDQERPNIFTQSVANIVPGATVEIEISYVQVLKFEDGQFEFNFPMTVGPRYLGNTPDAGKVAPPITPKGTRTGSGIELTAWLDAGAPIQDAHSVLHDVNIQKQDPSHWVVRLAKRDEIPNRDFILRYSISTANVSEALLTHADPRSGGYFTLVLMPPKAPVAKQVSPREIIFVMDRSGSQSGFPIEKSKELTRKLIDTLRPEDTLNIVSFSNDVDQLWPEAVEATPEAKAEALKYVNGLDADGGTEMLKAIEPSLGAPLQPGRVRIVVFNTDGFIGDEWRVLDAVKQYRNKGRMFTFGIGNSVNRFLIDSMAAEARGDAEYVTLSEQADEAVARFVRRIRTPVLTDVKVSFEGLKVADVLPREFPDVFSQKPVVIKGRYTQPGAGRIVVSGYSGGEPWSRTVDVELPAQGQTGSAVASLWAREKVDDLMRLNWQSHRTDQPTDAVKEQITNLALDYGLMTQYTSFVAVEERVVNQSGKLETVQVPVEMADGVKYETTVGAADAEVAASPKQLALHAGFTTLTRQQTGAVVAGKAKSMGGGGMPSAGPATVGPGGAVGVGGNVAFRKSRIQGRGLYGAKGVASAADPMRSAAWRQHIQRKIQVPASAHGPIRVAIELKEWSQAGIERLVKLGLRVTGKDPAHRRLEGMVDASKLRALAGVRAVLRIRPAGQAAP